ncbi:hypothetical protein [Mesorhizobium sp.]|uniref:hypothetical protein n=1 Tax=Mesorhizobium sp. TaxID=1871066 RepID=UPI000FE68588|nr:hypothetical protein [Mesorhizobium sp.]RWO99808.1 MAG: hypothetical protein EOQ99_27815 [Mesorhizobium sp.]
MTYDSHRFRQLELFCSSRLRIDGTAANRPDSRCSVGFAIRSAIRRPHRRWPDDPAFAPSIANPGILESPTYAATLKAAHASLADLAAQTGDPDRAMLCDALSVLDRAQYDRFIFDNACRALMRG